MKLKLLKRLLSTILALTMILSSIVFSNLDFFGLKVSADDQKPKVTVLFYNSDTSTEVDTIKTNFRVFNNDKSNLDLKKVILRYYFTSDGAKNLKAEIVNFFKTGTASNSNVKTKIVSIPNAVSSNYADTYLEIGFNGSAGELLSGKFLDVSIDIKDDKSVLLTQTNDYSFLPSNNYYTQWKNVLCSLVNESNPNITTEIWGSLSNPLSIPSNTSAPTPSSTPVPTVNPLSLSTKMPIATFNKSSVELGKPNTINYSQTADLTANLTVNSVKPSPGKKDVLMLLDTSYALQEGEDPFTSLFKFSLFSKSNALFTGGGINITGSTFIRDTLTAHTVPNLEQSIESDGTKSKSSLEFQNFTRNDLYGQLVSNNLEDGTIVKMTEKSQYERHDDLLNDDSQGYKKLIDHITNEANRISVEKDLANLVYIDDPDLYKQNQNKVDLGNGLFIEYSQIASSTFKNDMCSFELKGTGVFEIKSSMYFEGNVLLSIQNGIKESLLPGVNSAFILAEGDIIFQGLKTDSTDGFKNVFLVSKNGNIEIQTGSANFSGIALAPKGTVTLQGGNNTFAGSFIGNDLKVTGQTSTFSGPVNSYLEEIKNRVTNFDGFDNIKSSIANLAVSLDNNTNANIMTYIEKANMSSNFGFYSLEEENERDSLISDINKIELADLKFDNNLGDALRQAYYQLKKRDVDTPKYIVVFTSQNPDHYSYVKDGIPMSTSNLLLDDGEANLVGKVDSKNTGTNYALEYVKKVQEDLINQYNSANNPKIEVLFVDLSYYKTKEDTTKLSQLASLLSVDSSEYFYPKIDEDLKVTTMNSIKDIINNAATKTIDGTPTTETKPYEGDLNLKSAVFKATLPENFKITGAQLVIGTQKVSLTTTAGSNKDTIITADLPTNKLLTKMADNKGFSINTDNMTLEITVEADEFFALNSDQLSIEKDYIIPGGENKDDSLITYTFEDINGDGNDEIITIPFNEMNLKVVYIKDVT